MLLRIVCLAVLSPLCVVLSLGLFATLAQWRVHRAIALDRILVYGTTESWQMSPESLGAIPNLGLPYLLSIKTQFPSFANFPVLLSAAAANWPGVLAFSLAAALIAVGGALAAGLGLVPRRWRLNAAAGEGLSRQELLFLSGACVRGASLCLLALPLVAAMAWYVTTSRDLTRWDPIEPIRVLPGGAAMLSTLAGLMLLSFGVGLVAAKRGLNAIAANHARCQWCGYRRGVGPGVVCPECGRPTASGPPTAPRPGPAPLVSRSVAFLLIAALALSAIAASPRLSRWLLLRSPPSSDIKHPARILGCRTGEVVWVRWPDGQGYVTVYQWHSPGEEMTVTGRGTARVAAAYLAGVQLDFEPSKAAYGVEQAPVSNAEWARVTMTLGDHPVSVLVYAGQFELTVPGAVEFFRYPEYHMFPTGPTAVAAEVRSRAREGATGAAR